MDLEWVTRVHGNKCKDRNFRLTGVRQRNSHSITFLHIIQRSPRGLHPMCWEITQMRGTSRAVLKLHPIMLVIGRDRGDLGKSTDPSNPKTTITPQAPHTRITQPCTPGRITPSVRGCTTRVRVATDRPGPVGEELVAKIVRVLPLLPKEKVKATVSHLAQMGLVVNSPPNFDTQQMETPPPPPLLPHMSPKGS